MFWISIADYTKNFSGTAICYVEDLHSNHVIRVSEYENFFKFTLEENASSVSVILAQFSEKMKGRIPDWKTSGIRLVVAKESSDG